MYKRLFIFFQRKVFKKKRVWDALTVYIYLKINKILAKASRIPIYFTLGELQTRITWRKSNRRAKEWKIKGRREEAEKQDVACRRDLI